MRCFTCRAELDAGDQSWNEHMRERHREIFPAVILRIDDPLHTILEVVTQPGGYVGMFIHQAGEDPIPAFCFPRELASALAVALAHVSKPPEAQA